MLGACRLSFVTFLNILLTYDQTILQTLKEAGDEGLSVQKIARHVYNASNNFFETISFEEVHRYVQYYLLKNSKSSGSLIENTGQRGVYRLNKNSAELQQLTFLFVDDEEESPTQCVDQSLSLF